MAYIRRGAVTLQIFNLIPQLVVPWMPHALDLPPKCLLGDANLCHTMHLLCKSSMINDTCEWPFTKFHSINPINQFDRRKWSLNSPPDYPLIGRTYANHPRNC